MLLQVASRPMDSSPTYTVGADVSRFQRSSVPGRAGGQSNNAAPAGSPAPAPSGTPSGQAIGPIVRIARGNNVTIVPVGAR
jgi:pilus assembly protein CpaB